MESFVIGIQILKPPDLDSEMFENFCNFLQSKVPKIVNVLLPALMEDFVLQFERSGKASPEKIVDAFLESFDWER